LSGSVTFPPQHSPDCGRLLPCFSRTFELVLTPALLGGEFFKDVGTLVEEQIMSVFNGQFGAAIATSSSSSLMTINLDTSG